MSMLRKPYKHNKFMPKYFLPAVLICCVITQALESNMLASLPSMLTVRRPCPYTSYIYLVCTGNT